MSPCWQSFFSGTYNNVFYLLSLFTQVASILSMHVTRSRESNHLCIARIHHFRLKLSWMLYITFKYKLVKLKIAFMCTAMCLGKSQSLKGAFFDIT